VKNPTFKLYYRRYKVVTIKKENCMSKNSMFNQIFDKRHQIIYKHTSKEWHRLIYQVLRVISWEVATIIFSQFDKNLELMSFDKDGRVQCDFDSIAELMIVNNEKKDT
jgi:hypothetical protein